MIQENLSKKIKDKGFNLAIKQTNDMPKPYKPIVLDINKIKKPQPPKF